MSSKLKVYKPSPTGAKFHACDDFGKLMSGPVGSGKSVTCMMDAYMHSLRMPVCDDGVRRARWMFVRNTQKMLKTTTIKTWLEWFPEDFTGSTFVKSSPMQHNFKFYDEQGVICKLEFYFIALDLIKDIRNLRSLEVTGIYFNELSEIQWPIFEEAVTRPRWPAAERMGLSKDDPKPYRIIADTNKTSERHWLKKFFVDELSLHPGWKYFDQPAALLEVDGKFIPNLEAENISAHGGYDYYLNMANTSIEKTRVLACNRWGAQEMGTLVFREFNPRIHYSEEVLEPVPGFELCVPFDTSGLWPCAIIFQFISGQIRVLDEIVPTAQIDIEDFAKMAVMPVLMSKYPGYKHVSPADPSGVAGKDAGYSYQILRLIEAGFNAFPAVTNKIAPRLGAVRQALTSMPHGQPAIVISKSCQWIYEAFVSGYIYRTIRLQGAYDPVPSEEPLKNEYSHVMDTLQYGAMHYIKPLEQRNIVKKRLIAINGQMIEV